MHFTMKHPLCNFLNMKILTVIAVIFCTINAQSLPTFELPDGAQLILPGGYKPGFSCEGRIYGYYADQGNDCQVFHICVPIADESGNIQTLQYPFFCGNQTVFNQEFLICDNAQNVDCGRAADFYAKNEDFGKIPPKV